MPNCLFISLSSYLNVYPPVSLPVYLLPCLTIFPGGSAGQESSCNAGELGSTPGLGRSPGGGKGYPLRHSALESSMDSPRGRKESDTTDQRLLSLGEGNGNPLRYSCLQNSTDGGARWASVHGVAKSRTRLSDFYFHFP